MGPWEPPLGPLWGWRRRGPSLNKVLRAQPSQREGMRILHYCYYFFPNLTFDGFVFDFHLFALLLTLLILSLIRYTAATDSRHYGHVWTPCLPRVVGTPKQI